jgi:Glutathione synthase/Ribosomal protein S6 modification enzyme (glutaminyl transferase)
VLLTERAEQVTFGGFGETRTMYQVAFATSEKSPNITADDRLVAEILGSQGITVNASVWDDPTVDWPSFDCVVIRSTWDYHLKAARYADWLRRCSAAGIKIWNPPEVVLANLNKRYLLNLAQQGINVVPTVYVESSAPQMLRDVLERHQWQEAVVKPAISASAYGTWRTSMSTHSEDQDRFQEQVCAHDVLVQPYLSEIALQGEWSLVFFGGEFSHAVLKRPTAGDFRVQREFGGNSAGLRPPPGLVEQARAVLGRVGSDLLYARVDGIERAGRFVLTELELNEPFLFLGYSSRAADRFASSICRILR